MAKRKLPILKPTEVVAKLMALGFEEVRQKGSHKQFRHDFCRLEDREFALGHRSAHLNRLRSDEL